MFVAYAALIVLASLNRETGLLLVFCYAAFFPRRYGQIALLALVWAAVTGALHLVLGDAPHVLGVAGTLDYNLLNLPDGSFTNALLIPLVIILGLAYRAAPPLLRRLVWVAGLYLVAIAVGAAWNEMFRLVLPIVPLLLPVIVTEAG